MSKSNTDMALEAIKAALDVLDNVKPTVDTVARLRALADRADKLQAGKGAFIKEEAKANPDHIAMGKHFKAVLIVGERRTLDADKVKALLGDELPNYEKVSTFEQLRFSAAL